MGTSLPSTSNPTIASAEQGPTMAGSSISVVVPVRDDRAGLEELLEALALQTERPDEIIVVDGGSVDGTLGVVAEFPQPATTVRTIVAPGVNIAGGRNVGVQAARNAYIACTDAGCRPDPGWLAAMSRALKSADVVGGVVVAEGQTRFEQALVLAHYPMLAELDRPSVFVRISHRLFGRRYAIGLTGGGSLAFRRAAWEAVGGFPEHQFAGEDHAFSRAAAESGLKLALEREAIVRWRPPSTLVGNARMFYVYCRGDVRSRGRSRHLLRLAAWIAGPVAAFRGGARTKALVALAGLTYIALPLRRAQLAGVASSAWWRIPLIVAVKDISQLLGAAHGTLDALRGVPQPTPRR
jgi:glycosyltransferase involved in cell wall biosynthesis